MTKINQEALDVLFNDGRTYNNWQEKPVEESLLKELYDLTKMAPTSANCQPLRVLFLTSDEAKEKLRPALAEGNVDKTMSAPVIAILGKDMKFYEKLPELFPHADAKSWFEGNDSLIEETAYRNGSLQGGYFILAARALGLDCGPMSGFDSDKVNETFFKGTNHIANFICNLGYGSEEGLFPRSPRPNFDDMCKVI